MVQNRMLRLAVPLLAVSAGMSTAPVSADPRLERLSPAHRALAERMVSYMSSADARYSARVLDFDGEVATETLARETDDSIYDVRVTRGPVIEKYGRMLAEGKKTQPGRREGELVWSRFYSIDIHPKTPLIGMLHATLVLQFYADGTGFAGGWLGVMNGTRIAADMERLARLVDGHFATYGRDPALYRRLITKGTEDTVTEFRRRPDPSGVSFYGPPLFPDDLEKSYDLVETLFGKFVDAYLDIVEERADDRFTADDVERQEAMRKRWLVDQLFSDPFASKLVPFEVWSLANVPPVIRF